MSIRKTQIGKNGLTKNFIDNLKNYFKNAKTIKILILKNADRSKIEKYRDEIIENLGKNFTAKKIGFTLVVQKWRKPMRSYL